MNWPDTLALRPIAQWPTTRTPDSRRKHSPFRASLNETLALLRRELGALRATGVVLEVAIPEGDVNWRQDGRPRASARADHPGVVLAFKTAIAPGRELRYATDRYRFWQHNLRAIALGLEALRKVERYGIADRGEQYAGWAQLPKSTSEGDAQRGKDLVQKLGSIKRALIATHPDTRSNGYGDSDYLDVVAYGKQTAAL